MSESLANQAHLSPLQDSHDGDDDMTEAEAEQQSIDILELELE